MPVKPLLCCSGECALYSLLPGAGAGFDIYYCCCSITEQDMQDIKTKFPAYVAEMRAALQRDRGRNAPAAVVGLDPITARSLSLNYTSAPHLDSEDFCVGFISWTMLPQVCVRRVLGVCSRKQTLICSFLCLAATQDLEASNKGEKKQVLAAPRTAFHLYGREPDKSSPAGGLKFYPQNGSVLMLDATRVYHNAASEAATDPNSPCLERGEVFGSAYVYKPSTQRAFAAVFEKNRLEAKAKRKHPQLD